VTPAVVLALAEYAVRAHADATQLGEQFGDVNRVEDLPEYVTRVAGHDTTVGHDELHHYWTKGPGLPKWIGSDHQFYTLREHLVRPPRARSQSRPSTTGRRPGSTT